MELETDRLELKERQIRASYAAELREAGLVQQSERTERAKHREQAAKFSAVREKLLNMERHERKPQMELDHAGFLLGRLAREKGELGRISARLRELQKKKIEVAFKVKKESAGLDHVAGLIRQRKLAAGKIRLEKQHEELLDGLSAKLATKSGADVKIADAASAIRETERIASFDVESASEDLASFFSGLPAGSLFSASRDNVSMESILSGLYGGGGGHGQNQSRPDGQGSSGGNTSESSGGAAGLKEYLRAFEDQVAAVNSWHGLNGSGVELVFINASGRRGRVLVRNSGDHTVNICLLPEHERDRRALWAEKENIVQALRKAGLRVGQVAVRRG